MKYAIFVIVAMTVLFLTGYQVLSMDDAKKKKGSIEMQDQNTRVAVFAGGCFWCTESDFEKVDGVVEAISGYTGGHIANPTYKQVSSGGTGHVEAIKVIYDPEKTDYEDLLEIYLSIAAPGNSRGAAF